ncbi:DNA-binding domain-containing protein [Pontixanthobacter aestiaquae]|uniref:Putative DNA-binding domain-containing protein n=1 Tax=Pontixanthobacter aestiaquae TaxID=1509367 RepID=A0A844Z620_9SPHN|nr:DNA-binding domain-containing protein [Pontixanthobacter aestiaquae]MDN3646485.1 DNA-binding domain-containing protein [Pontixanthobacter aestiaquae]MXO82527.1 hypothetical protein [Pontixanthobacter aestiaquae]
MMPSQTLTLAERQQEFMAQVLDDERVLPDGWTPRHAAGMDIYRNAYRARLVDALRDTYERTAKWVGEDAYRQAAAHHVITHPPKSWTLDHAADGFPDTLRELFTNNPEVAELGWLEWAMHQAFVAADAEPIDAAKFGEVAASFAEEDWAHMRLTFLPGTVQLRIAHDIGKLWRALGEEDAETPDFALEHAHHCVVWREGFKPVFMQVEQHEGRALEMMRGGASYGEMCEALVEMLGEEEAVAQAGAMLGRWLHNGLIASVSK